MMREFNTPDIATKQPVVFIVGPTGSGKTAAALTIARRYPVEIINADSRQVYRGMDIGTAKPVREDMASAPHHVIDVVDPDEPYNLALFLDQARSALESVLTRGKIPFVVGGTGQYVWGLVEGWQVPPVPPQRALRARLELEAKEKGSDVLYRRLQRIDATAAERIDPRNVRRLVRALEVWEITGHRFSSQRFKIKPPFTPQIFGMQVPREELYRRINARVGAMVDAGWVDEVRRLLNAGYTTDLPSFSSAGYREFAAFIAGELEREETFDLTKAAVRRLARRQGSWFRGDDPRITWLEGVGELAEAVGRLRNVPMVQSAWNRTGT